MQLDCKRKRPVKLQVKTATLKLKKGSIVTCQIKKETIIIKKYPVTVSRALYMNMVKIPIYNRGHAITRVNK